MCLVKLWSDSKSLVWYTEFDVFGQAAQDVEITDGRQKDFDGAWMDFLGEVRYKE